MDLRGLGRFQTRCISAQRIPKLFISNDDNDADDADGLVGKSVALSYSWSCCTGDSNPGRGTVVGGVFHLTKQLARFSPPNMAYILNSKFI